MAHPCGAHFQIERAGIDDAEDGPNRNDRCPPRYCCALLRSVHLLYFGIKVIASDNPALALVLHVSRSCLRYFASKISIDHSQREIYSGRQPTRSRDLLLLDKTQSTLNADVGKGLGKPVQ